MSPSPVARAETTAASILPGPRLLSRSPNRASRWTGSTREASTRVADYWILNLVERVLEIYREPILDPTTRFGWRYASLEILAPGASAAPLVAPAARIPVSDLLP